VCFYSKTKKGDEMKRFAYIMLILALVPMAFGDNADLSAPSAVPSHVFKVQGNQKGVPYNGPFATPTLVDTIDLSPINATGYCWGLAYDWERDALWVTQWNSAYNKMYAIQKHSPCTKVDSVTLVSGLPTYRLGIGYGGSNTMYMAGYNTTIYRINMTNGTGSSYRTVSSTLEGFDFNVVDDALYGSDWSTMLDGYAKPSQTGTWTTWSVAQYPCGMSGAYSATTAPTMLFQAEEASPSHFYQYHLTNGVPAATPESTWQCDPGQTQGSEADCAFDGRYVYILDQSGPDKIWVYDIGIAGTDHDVGTMAILAPGLMILPNTTINPSARYRNYGGFTETFDVYFKIDSAGVNIYYQTANITLASATDTTINWPNWTSCGTNGIIYDITAYTVLAGDANPANDTINQQTTVSTVYWEILDPPAFPAPTSGHSQASADDGTYIVFSAGSSNNEIWIYNILSDTWASGASNPSGTAAFGTADYVNGLFYRIGGWNGSSAMSIVNIYNAGSNSWTNGASAPVPMIDHMTGVYNNQLIYCFGGGNWYSGVPCRNTVYYYDVVNNTWTQATSFPGAPRGCLSSTVIDTFAVVAGGFDDQLWAMRNDYVVGHINPSNPATITWGTPTTIPAIDSNYRVPCGTDKWNKEFYMSCGQKWTTTLNRTFSYNPYTDTWTEWFYPKPTPVCNVSPIVLTPTLTGDVGLFIAGGYHGSSDDCHEVLHTAKLYGIEEKPGSGLVPLAFGFAPKITNPTKGYSAITYTTTVGGQVILTVYDAMGRLVRTLVNRPKEAAGTKTVFWNGKDDSKRSVASGVYFLKLEAEGKVATHKLVLVK